MKNRRVARDSGLWEDAEVFHREIPERIASDILTRVVSFGLELGLPVLTLLPGSFLALGGSFIRCDHPSAERGLHLCLLSGEAMLLNVGR